MSDILESEKVVSTASLGPRPSSVVDVAGRADSTPFPPFTPETKTHIRRDIQGLRGLAVGLVVLYHAGAVVPGGFVGVDIFLVVSGFVIASVLFRELHSTDGLRLGEFYERRVRRLLPSLAVMIVVVDVFAVFLMPMRLHPTIAATGKGAATFSANMTIYSETGNYFSDHALSNPFLHTWSLALEEQFYLAFPALLMLLWKLGRRRWSVERFREIIAIPLFLLAAASFLFDVMGTLDRLPFKVKSGPSLAFFSMPLRAWEFLAGVIVATIPAKTGGASKFHFSGVFGLLIAVLSAFVYDARTSFPGITALLPTFGTALVLLAGSKNASSGASRLLATRPLTFLGDISYGWYLWHWPAIAFAQVLWPQATWLLVPIAVGSLLPTMISYKFIENPVRLNRYWTGRRAVALVCVCSAGPWIASSVVSRGAKAGWGVPQLRAVSARSVAVSCVDTSNQFPAEACRWKVPNSRGLVFVVGDSHAYSVSDGAIVAGNKLGYDVAVWSRSGCPFLTIPTYGAVGCAEFQREALRLAAKAQIVVVANRSPGYTLPPVGDGSNQKPWRTISALNGGRAKTSTEALDSWKRGVEGVVSTLERSSAFVVWVSTVPEYPVNPGNPVSLVQPLAPDLKVSLKDVDLRRSGVLRVEAAVLSRHANVRVVDPAQTLCDTQSCSATRGGRSVYLDSNHLNPVGSNLLVPSFLVAFGQRVDLTERAVGTP